MSAAGALLLLLLAPGPRAAEPEAVLPPVAPASATLQSPLPPSSTETDLERRLREQDDRIKQLEAKLGEGGTAGKPGAPRSGPAWWEYGCMGCCGAWALLFVLAAL